MSKKGSIKPLISFAKEKMVQCNGVEDAIFNIKVISKYIEDKKIDIDIDKAYNLLEENNNFEQSIELIMKYNYEQILDENISTFIAAYNLKNNIDEELENIDISEEDLEENIELSDNIINDYLKSINHRLLTKEEEIELSKRKEQGDEEARNQLVKNNLRWVVCIAKKYKNRTGEFIDLIQEGSIGLITAADKYDYRKGYRFSTYSKWWIEQAIILYLKNLTRVVRIPKHILEKNYKIQKYIDEFLMKNYREPTLDELLKAFPNITRRTMIDCLTASRNYISLNEPISNGKNDSEDELGDFIKSPQDYLEEWVNQEFFKEFMYKVLKQILKDNVSSKSECTRDGKSVYDYLISIQHTLMSSNRELKILVLKFGLDGSKPKTGKEIGQLFGVSQQRIDQLEKKALHKLSINPGIMEFFYGFFNIGPESKKMVRKK